MNRKGKGFQWDERSREIILFLMESKSDEFSTIYVTNIVLILLQDESIFS